VETQKLGERNAVLWLRRLVAGLSQWRLGFKPGPVHVGFVVDKEALGQVLPVSIISPWLSIPMHHLGDEREARSWP
jgi:hypothetical protein